jgi:hypothetical protein
MEITLGYLKDAIAFTCAVLVITVMFLFRIECTHIKYLFYALILLIIIFDGSFTCIPWLHNYSLYNSS